MIVRVPSLKGDPSKSGSIASTMWRLFVYKKFNPLDLK